MSTVDLTEKLLRDIREITRERDEARAALAILKDPSDGRCMEIGALRERTKIAEQKLAAATAKIERIKKTLRYVCACEPASGHPVALLIGAMNESRLALAYLEKEDE